MFTRELKTGDTFNSSVGALHILSYLGKGKSGNSYLAENGSLNVVLKVMHNEPNPYYSFKGNKVSAETDSYNKLAKLNINMPKLLAAHPDENYLIKEYIPGKVASELIAAGNMTESIFQTLFEYSAQLKRAGLNVDYFPNNFVVTSFGELYYIDYETNEYSDEWNLDNWGIYYWLNSEGFKKFLETGDAAYINSDVGSGIPIKNRFEDEVEKLIAAYSR